MTQCIHPLILSGGSGSRLWPMSRSAHPKQFLNLGDAHTMIARTALRVSDAARFHSPTVLSNTDHRFLVLDALESAGCPPASVLLEPVARNTAAAVAVGAVHLAARDEDALVLVLPSDHVVRDEQAFLAAVEQGASLASEGRIVTFGVVARTPETGYGYIQKGSALAGGAHEIARFCEKPDVATAATYLASGDYFWNSGMFLFSARALLEEMQSLCPELLEHARSAHEKAQADLGFMRLDTESFAAIESLSFDVAVMEKTKRGAVVPVEMGWSDVGSWRALWEVMPKDVAGNAGQGDAQFFSSKNCLAWSATGVFTSVVGLEHVAVISTDDAVLVMDARRSEEVRDVVEYLKKNRRSEHAVSSKVYRPWGSYQNIDAGKGYLVKRLEVKPGARLSLQYHHHRAEHWTVVEGTATITRGNEVFDLRTHFSTYITQGTAHRLENKQSVPLVLIEVQSGDYIDEGDIVRLEDHYGRDKYTPLS